MKGEVEAPFEFNTHPSPSVIPDSCYQGIHLHFLSREFPGLVAGPSRVTGTGEQVGSV